MNHKYHITGRIVSIRMIQLLLIDVIHIDRDHIIVGWSNSKKYYESESCVS